MTPNLKRARHRGALAWMTYNPVAANLFMLVLLVGGILMAFRIKKEMFPEFDIDEVSISVSYPGASPEEVEQGIVLAVEEAVRAIDGIKEVSATASEGRASVTAELISGVNSYKVMQEIEQGGGSDHHVPGGRRRARGGAGRAPTRRNDPGALRRPVGACAPRDGRAGAQPSAGAFRHYPGGPRIRP